ncbi:nucleotide sugar dehydrogenase [Mesorhizobium sp. M0203]|uniref:nucleotide sugar dehydrogenase n=1 Tax=Mesorhizobium sp. M0203 TaxID=2956912 RepID=UPI00333A81AE
MNEHFGAAAQSALAKLIAAREAVTGIIGLGYVGLPLSAACARAGFPTIGFDVDENKIVQLNSGQSYIDAVSSADLSEQIGGERFRATADFSELAKCDVVIICVPTPLSRYREPDLRYVEATAETIARNLRSGQLVVLESTTYPGTTEEIVKPILEGTHLKSGSDFFLGFSPEREDPGNTTFRTTTIPKVVAGDGSAASSLMEAFYGAVVDRVVVVSSPKVSEAVKITENVFRAVNIALVNELKMIYDAMGIDIWEVIDAASTKPFGFMPFYPGPGLGGHCIPIDPFYLTWKSREYGLTTRFIELAGEINVSMPRYVINKLENALDRFQQVSLSSSRILILGLAYKKNVSDIRESPSFELMEMLEKRGSSVAFHDPHAGTIPMTRDHAAFAGGESVSLNADVIQGYNAVVVATDHDAIDYELIAANAKLIVDTRNVFARKNIEIRNIMVKA